MVCEDNTVLNCSICTVTSLVVGKAEMFILHDTSCRARMLTLKALPPLGEVKKTRGRQNGQPVVGELEELRCLLPRQGRSYTILTMWWHPHVVRFENLSKFDGRGART